MITPVMFEVAQCPDCAGRLRPAGRDGVCDGCGRRFPGEAGYLDLRPRAAFTEQTKYLDEALHADARHESIAPPLLGSKVRNDRLRRFLALGPADRAIDLGCGSGRALAWNADTGALLTGLDISPFFAHEAIDGHGLILGDLRRLPLRDGAFTKAWSLDVLEHLSPEALREMLAEANRVLAPGGALFVYSHVRKNGPVAVGVRLVNRLADALDRVGLIDLRRERLRKSDHVNPLADHDDLARVTAACGFRLERVTYYTPIVGAFVENVLMRLAERLLMRRAAAGRDGVTEDTAAREVRAAAKTRLRQRGPSYRVLQAVSALMQLDLVLFGRLRSGPFFALLRKTGPPAVGEDGR